MKGITIIAIAFNLIFGMGGATNMLQYIRALQLILHMPLLSTILPANLMMVFNLVMPVVMFDVLDLEVIKDYQPAAWLSFDKLG